ncbi:CRAL-TRIO domain-containing protein [Thelephora terrestris]|uniref:CRAL-TRIO domain-containing protein n=1 Tax=Thelephora terrestris TaxID=56493 RepID=A0A9P6LAT3_9AGAM|nr:CRAL-TRIO domain-containing protein [Thelephora terrestris]
MMERAVEIMPRGVESVAVIALYSAASKSASLGHSKQIVDTLQSYFPERLGRCAVINGPFWSSIFITLVDPFLDPITRSKIAVNRQLIAEGDVTPDQTIKELGGERELVWECDRCLYKLVEISGEMKVKRLNEWREKLGGRIGITRRNRGLEACGWRRCNGCLRRDKTPPSIPLLVVAVHVDH